MNMDHKEDCRNVSNFTQCNELKKVAICRSLQRFYMVYVRDGRLHKVQSMCSLLIDREILNSNRVRRLMGKRHGEKPISLKASH